MRNPALCLVGIAASPGGGGVFGSRAEEELRLWLETRLDALGIDPIAYSRFVLSLLRRPDSALSPLSAEVDRGRRNRARPRPRLQGDRDQRRAVVQCLTKAADQKCGVEALVDELCVKLRDLEGGNSNDDNEECRQIGQVKENTVEVLTARDRALRYYAAFPALQPATPKKTPHRKDKNSGATNNNLSNNNNYSYNNNKNRSIGVNNNNNNNKTTCINNNNHSSNNSKTRPKKSKMSIQAIDLRRAVDKEKFGFAKSMEREREKERELELDRLRLAQLQAKFDESLEALWDSCGPGGAQDKSSIWAAPSVSIPNGPLWPVDTSEVPLILPINDTVSAINTPYQDSIVDDSPIIPWDIDFKYTDEGGTKEKIDYNFNWSDCGIEGPWSWKNLGNNLINVDNSPKNCSSFFSATPHKSPIVKTAESALNPMTNCLEEVEEDLLTSARTHFRPIKDDGHWADGTTFPVNNNPDKVSYQRSESGHLLYLPGEENPYMKYRESTALTPLAAPQTFTLKFRVRQCDKSIQTDPIRSPVKRRILTGTDHFYYSSIDGSEDYLFTQEPNDIEPDMFRIGHLDWIQPSVSLLNDRKRRHSSSFNCHPLAALRPLTL